MCCWDTHPSPQNPSSLINVEGQCGRSCNLMNLPAKSGPRPTFRLDSHFVFPNTPYERTGEKGWKTNLTGMRQYCNACFLPKNWLSLVFLFHQHLFHNIPGHKGKTGHHGPYVGVHRVHNQGSLKPNSCISCLYRLANLNVPNWRTSWRQR